MPTIAKRKPKERIKILFVLADSLSSKYYNSLLWKNLRNQFIRLHPVCECCDKHGYTREAKEVHHYIPWLQGKDEEERYKLLLDEDNLISLCKVCHAACHAFANKKHSTTVGLLNEKEYSIAHNLKYLS